MAITLDAATLISICTESVLYGIYLVFYVACIYILVRKQRKGQPIKKLLIAISTIMMIFSTFHLVCDLARVLDAFLRHTGSSADYLIAVNNKLYILKTASYFIQTLVGDGFIIYRLYWVWQRDKRIVSPFLVCFLASFGVGIALLYVFSHATPTEQVFKLERFVISFFVLTLFTNLCCTCLIASRIWWKTRQITKTVTVRGRTAMSAMVVIVESGAIYSTCLVILLILYEIDSYAQYFFLDALNHIIGIVFSMIIVRIGLGLHSMSKPTSEAMSTLFITPPRSTTIGETRASSQVLPAEAHTMAPLPVKFSHETFNYNGVNEGKLTGMPYTQQFPNTAA